MSREEIAMKEERRKWPGKWPGDDELREGEYFVIYFVICYWWK